MVSERCDRLWEVDALREARLGADDAASFDRHRATCATCDARYRADERLRSLGQALPTPIADPLEVRRQRGRLLRDAALGNAAHAPQAVRSRAAFIIAACAVAALVAALFAVPRARAPSALASASIGPAMPTAVASAFAASVRASSGALWTQGRAGLVETIGLEQGTISVAARPQQPDERLLVALPDGEIEVRGTVFEVTVNAGKTLAVDVREGLVALRLRGAGEVLLGAGETWPPATVVATVPSGRAPAPSAPSAPSTPTAALASAAPAASAAVPREYDEAMRLYRERRYDDAARAFHMFAASHGGAPEAEDAAFLEAAALAYAGRADAAALVAERFLERYPRSFHAKDAAVLVARVARDRGDCARARRVLAPWSASGAADVRAALGACAP